MIKKLLVSLTALLAVAAPVALTASPASASPRSQAVSMAYNYLSYTAFSCSGLIDQLVFEQFSYANASYGAHQTRAC